MVFPIERTRGCVVTTPGWVDEPIESKKQDELDRSAFVEEICLRFESMPKDLGSSVSALMGAWGSGKTSIINLIIESLQVERKKWLIVKFNPWMASDSSTLLEEFYSAILSAFPKKPRKELARSFGRMLSAGASALALVPVYGDALQGVAKTLGNFMADRGSWIQEFENASKIIEKIDSRVLIVIDDIDRLQSDELLSVFKIVRLLGRFKGVHYLLSYDEKSVLNILSKSSLVGTGNIGPAAYLEKMVQFSYRIPELSYFQRKKRFEQEVRSVLSDFGANLDNRTISEESFRLVLDLAVTPRAKSRFASLFRHKLRLISMSEICPDDLFLLAAVEYFSPSVFARLFEVRDLLKSSKSGVDTEQLRPFISSTMQSSGPQSRDEELVQRCLYRVFEARADRSRLVGGDRTASSAIYLERYFVYSLHSSDLSEERVEIAVCALEQGNSDLLIELFDGGKEVPHDYLVTALSRRSVQFKDRISFFNSVSEMVRLRVNLVASRDLSASELRYEYERWLISVVRENLEMSHFSAIELGLGSVIGVGDYQLILQLRDLVSAEFDHLERPAPGERQFFEWSFRMMSIDFLNLFSRRSGPELDSFPIARFMKLMDWVMGEDWFFGKLVALIRGGSGMNFIEAISCFVERQWLKQTIDVEDEVLVLNIERASRFVNFMRTHGFGDFLDGSVPVDSQEINGDNDWRERVRVAQNDISRVLLTD